MRLVAVSWRGEFFAQDPTDGFLVPVGHTGFTRINSLTVTPDDRVLCIAEREDANPVVIEIDPDTGRGAEVCVLDAMVDARALAAAPSGMLYAVIARPDDLNRCSLAEVDISSGRVVEVARYGVIGLEGIEFCPHGDLFGFLNEYDRESADGGRLAQFVRLRQPEWGIITIEVVPSWPWPVRSLAFDGCDVGHIAAWEPDHEGGPATRILTTITGEVQPLIKIGRTEHIIRHADIRGIGFLGAYGWSEACCRDEMQRSDNEGRVP